MTLNLLPSDANKFNCDDENFYRIKFFCAVAYHLAISTAFNAFYIDTSALNKMIRHVMQGMNRIFE
jgi:hypothetical protein